MTPQIGVIFRNESGPNGCADLTAQALCSPHVGRSDPTLETSQNPIIFMPLHTVLFRNMDAPIFPKLLVDPLD